MSILRIRDENGEVQEIMTLVGPQGKPGVKGDRGDPGTAGVSVSSVKQTTTSIADGGDNVVTVTLSNGTTSTFTVKNGSKGSNGVSATHSWNGTTLTVTSASGTSSANLKGDKGDAGADYVITDADKADILADVRATANQQTPLFANGIDECTDTSKVYVLPDGYIYGYIRKLVYHYTNQIPLSVNSDGSQFVGANGEDGYAKDTLVIVSTGGEKSYTGTMATGFIPVKNGDVLYFKDYLLKPGVGDSKCQFVLYKSNFGHLSGATPDAISSYGYLFKYTSYASGYLETLTIVDKYNNGIAYLRFSAPNIDKAIITVNEPIVDPTYEYTWANTGHKFIPADHEERIIPLEEAAEDHETRIKTLEMYGSESTSASDIPAYIKTEADSVMSRLSDAQGNRNFTMIAMSDFHYSGTGDNKDNLIRACKAISYITNRIHVDAIATLGDNMPYGGDYNTTMRANADRWNKEINEILAITQRSGIVEFRTPGNHDRWGTPEQYMPDNAIYSFISGYNRQCDYIDVPGGYAYRDFPGHNLRVIVLNSVESEGMGRFSDTNGGGGYHMTTKQYRWLIDALDLSGKPNASNWQIVLLSHHRADDHHTFALNTESYFLPNILHAYNTGGSFSGVSQEDGATISCNFAGKNSAKLIGQIHGHHHSYIYGNLYRGRTYDELTGSTGVMAVSTPTLGFGSGSSHNDDNDGNNYPNVKDTAEETAFCVYSIDLDNHVIHAIHYGAGIDREISY